MRDEAAGHQIESVGKDLRSMMPWIDQGAQALQERARRRAADALRLGRRERMPL